MSAHLTVYSMAIAAERPLRLQAADQARLAAEAEAALERGTKALLSRLGSALRQSWWSEVTAERWTIAGSGGRLTEQPAN
jgi:hypothetical protein